jgi:murein DD-endopeptidase MepM/ murein hydrolase activator NlpD
VPSRNRSSSSHSLRCPTGIRVVGLACAVVAGSAVGGTAAQAGDEGGAMYVVQPRIAKVSCLRKCAPRKRIQAGSTLRITGEALSGVTGITFHGGRGRSDDVTSDVRSGSDRRIHAAVPIGATTGRISATGGGLQSKRSRVIGILPPPPPEPNPTLTPVPGPRETGAPRLETGTSRTKAYIDAKPTVTFSYRVTEGLPQTVTVELLRTRDGAVVRSWSPDVAEDAVQSVRWNGRTGRRPASSGRYSFRLTVAGADGRTARSAAAQDVGRDAFDLYDHVFPVRGRHDYGGAGAHFGSGRSGHSHQGHDVFARCGTKLVAARGGRVKFTGYHAAAGNYVVIDGAGTTTDYAYMHLEQPTPFPTGARVYTGQALGTVGDTGNAQGCHLHFEMWGAPGWYDGGSPFDPYRSLRTWDSWS